jgi:hypothetical protein
MTYQSIEEIEQLVRSFETCQLPRSLWTHHAHLTVALWFLIHYPQPEAIERIKVGIQRYNQSVGIENSQTSGYHETITRFWIHKIQAFLNQEIPAQSTLDRCNELMQNYSDPKLPFQYYSHDYLMSWQARSTWVESDLRPLF